MISFPRTFLASLCFLTAAIADSGSSTEAANVRLVPMPDLGITAVHIEGQFVSGDAKRIRGQIAAAKFINPANRVFVTLHSPGGLVVEAMDLGRHLREQGVGTLLLSNAVCHSACGYVFWGGYDLVSKAPRRILMKGARLSVHRNFYPTDKAAIIARAKLAPDMLFQILHERVAQTLDYLLDLDVSPDTLRRLYGTGRNDAYVLKDHDLAADKVLLLERDGGAWVLRGGYFNSSALPPFVKRIETPEKPATVSDRPGLPAS